QLRFHSIVSPADQRSPAPDRKRSRPRLLNHRPSRTHDPPTRRLHKSKRVVIPPCHSPSSCIILPPLKLKSDFNSRQTRNRKGPVMNSRYSLRSLLILGLYAIL